MPPFPTPFSTLRALSRQTLPSPRTLPISSRASQRFNYTTSSNPKALPLRTESTTDSAGFKPLTLKQTPQKRKPHGPPQWTALGPQNNLPRPPHAQGLTQPSYQMTFTCDPCGKRSSHMVSKQGYHFGSVLITCPECRNRHVISDHLNMFGDRNITIEDLMREKGRLVKKGTLSEDGDLEFWADGTTTKRNKPEFRAVDEIKEEDGGNVGQ